MRKWTTRQRPKPNQRRIGLSYVATKYFDLTGDGEDEAVVIRCAGAGGSAVRKVVYVLPGRDAESWVILAVQNRRPGRWQAKDDPGPKTGCR